MASNRLLTYYYPVRKKDEKRQDPDPTAEKPKPPQEDSPDYTHFLQCNNTRFTMPASPGLPPLTPYRDYTLDTWIYPGSKSFRKYQFLICRSCLFSNTLVCLPTGLGKTFIATVVLYNYYRWFREGLVFFLAPTKPLVDQQFNAFVETVKGFNPRHVGQMTGKLNKSIRRATYKTARVFFMTPQTLENDLRNELVDKQKITCIVFDEAHRATGNYAYCQIVKQMKEAGVGFRIVALSATPGPTVESIQEIINNLMISCVEARSEEDPDVKQYTHNKNIEVIKVGKTGEITKLEDQLLKVIAIPQHQLQAMQLLPFVARQKAVNKMMVLESQEKFKREAAQFERTHGMSGMCMAYSCFSSLLSLLSGLSMLVTHGIDSLKMFCEKFRDSVEEKKGRKTIVNSKEFQELLKYLNDIGTTKNHPKLEKMKETLTKFLEGEDHKRSQAIVFTLFVNSAQEICKYLGENDTISANVFIGQANGYTQKQQMKIINDFKAHKFNTLVATCIGEEGLDIGYVDLIVSYDCTGSPVRMIQRFGRTGRQQEGKVVILLCEEEEKRYAKMKKSSKYIYDVLKASSDTTRRRFKTTFALYGQNSKMIKEEKIPTCIYATKDEDFLNPKESRRSSRSTEFTSAAKKSKPQSESKSVPKETAAEKVPPEEKLPGSPGKPEAPVEEEKLSLPLERTALPPEDGLSEEILAEMVRNSRLWDPQPAFTGKEPLPALIEAPFSEELLDLAEDLLIDVGKRQGDDCPSTKKLRLDAI